MADELDKYDWAWVAVDDNKVCPDCEALAKLEPTTYTEWTEDRTEPGRGDTVCGDYCRCVMVPINIIEMHPDLLDGGGILLRGQDPNLIVTKENEYEMFSQLDDLIGRYKEQTNGAKLPQAYYDITNIDGRIAFLEDFLGD